LPVLRGVSLDQLMRWRPDVVPRHKNPDAGATNHAHLRRGFKTLRGTSRQRLALFCGHRIARTSTEMFTGSSSAPLADRARGAWPHSGYRERDLGSG
jgi:hypothetical protein